MAQSIAEYTEWLDGRGLTWPKVPDQVPVKAAPYSAPLEGIKAVTWSVYGTLLRISDGELLFTHPQELRMEVAIEKTIKEFKMWNSMTRKPGAPWKYMLSQFEEMLDEARHARVKHTGETPAVNLGKVWEKLVRRLELKDYEYDHEFYGNEAEFGQKVAFFYHKCLQSVGAMNHAVDVLERISHAGMDQALLADAQPFTLDQMMRAFDSGNSLSPLGELFTLSCCTLSFQEGICKPSKSLYVSCVERFEKRGVEPEEILHVGSRMKDDLAIAKQTGMRTALFAGDKLSFQATQEEVRDAKVKPDRLITDLSQLLRVLELE